MLVVLACSFIICRQGFFYATDVYVRDANESRRDRCSNSTRNKDDLCLVNAAHRAPTYFRDNVSSPTHKFLENCTRRRRIEG